MDAAGAFSLVAWMGGAWFAVSIGAAGVLALVGAARKRRQGRA